MRFVLRVFSLLVISLSVMSSPAIGKGVGEVPEYFFANVRAKYCVYKVTIRGDDTSLRKRSMLAFLDRAFQYTGEWKKSFALASVDYEGFRTFAVVWFRSCSRASSVVREAMDKLWQPRLQNCSGSCSPPPISLQQEYPSSIVSYWNSTMAKKMPTPIAMFLYYRPKSQLQSCTIRLHNVDRGIPGPTSPLRADLFRVREKYRMSILDLSFVGSDAYILFSRMCQSKKRRFDLFVEFLKREHSSVADKLGAPDLSPDISDYYFSQTGE